MSYNDTERAALILSTFGFVGLGVAFFGRDGHAIAGAIVYAATLLWGEWHARKP